MKKLFLFAIGMLMSVVTQAGTYTLVNGVLTVTPTGGETDFYLPDLSDAEKSQVTEVIVGAGYTSMGGYDYRKYRACSNLASITLPEGMTSIGVSCFFQCESLTTVNLPSTLESIGELAFNGCKKLENITIPSSVTWIGPGAFSACKSFAIAPANPKYCIIDKVLYEKDASGNPTTAICAATSVTSVTIPNTVTKIDKSAFAMCANLSAITIPNSVNRIEVNAFDHCSSLTSVRSCQK